MPGRSAGLLMFRRRGREVEVFLVHPGGPFWSKKDEGAWSIPKGIVEEGEDIFQTAIREFEEETGLKVSAEKFITLSPLKLKSGKIIHAWAFEGDCDPGRIKSNTFKMEWPPKSGRIQEFPEIDRAGWFTLNEARKKINPGQVNFIDQLENNLQDI